MEPGFSELLQDILHFPFLRLLPQLKYSWVKSLPMIFFSASDLLISFLRKRYIRYILFVKTYGNKEAFKSFEKRKVLLKPVSDLYKLALDSSFEKLCEVTITQFLKVLFRNYFQQPVAHSIE